MSETGASNSTVNYIKEEDFNRISSSEGVYVFDFTATWCGPCKMVAPMMDRLAQEHEGKVQVFKVDLDENPGLAKKLGIRSIPFVMIYKNGDCSESIVGLVPYEKFNTAVTNLL